MGHTMYLAAQGDEIRYFHFSIWGGGGPSQFPLSHSMLNLADIFQQPHCKVRISVRSEDSLVQMVCVRQALSHHPKSIGLCIVDSNDATYLTGHTYHLPYICVQADLVKELWQDVNRPLDSFCLLRCKNSIICI